MNHMNINKSYEKMNQVEKIMSEFLIAFPSSSSYYYITISVSLLFFFYQLIIFQLFPPKNV